MQKTPYENWFGRPPALNRMRIFGSIAYAKVTGYLKKFDDRAKRFIFVGYAPTGYRLFDPEKSRITVSRDVKILDGIYLSNVKDVKSKHDLATIENLLRDEVCWKDESLNLLTPENKNNTKNADVIESEQSVNSIELEENLGVSGAQIFSPASSEISSAGDKTPINDLEWQPGSSDWNSSDSEIQTIIAQKDVRRYPDRERVKTKLFPEPETKIADSEKIVNKVPNDKESNENIEGSSNLCISSFPNIYAFMAATDAHEPETFKQVMKSENKEEWISAMRCEMDSMKGNNVWKLVPRPKNCESVVRLK